jgi:hypothetical protein
MLSYRFINLQRLTSTIATYRQDRQNKLLAERAPESLISEKESP